MDPSNILELNNQFSSLNVDDPMQEPSEVVRKDKSAAKLKRAKKRAVKAEAKAAVAKTKLEKLVQQVKLKEANDIIMMEAPFDGPSTSKAALRHDEELRCANKIKWRSAVAAEPKKKHNLNKAGDKKYEVKQARTFAGYRALSQFPQRVGREKHISVLLEYNEPFKRGKKVMKVKPRLSTKKDENQQSPQLDDEAEFPSLG